MAKRQGIAEAGILDGAIECGSHKGRGWKSAATEDAASRGCLRPRRRVARPLGLRVMRIALCLVEVADCRARHVTRILRRVVDNGHLAHHPAEHGKTIQGVADSLVGESPGIAIGWPGGPGMGVADHVAGLPRTAHFGLGVSLGAGGPGGPTAGTERNSPGITHTRQKGSSRSERRRGKECRRSFENGRAR